MYNNRNYRIFFFEIIDNIIMQIDKIFGDLDKLRFVSLADTSKFDSYSRNFPYDPLSLLPASYFSVLKTTQLLNTERELLYQNSEYRNIPVKKVLELLRNNDVNKDVFGEVYKLYSLILILPSTSVSVERNFWCLKRIKTKQRNSMSQKRLSALRNISLQKDVLDKMMESELFHENIGRFAALKEWKINLVYKR
ncbi:hypothetical protein ANN_17369 [Periplaneta americana]|uniref:HAT C-terminal dimerisation domain-containing protein n=1 Tax=Periplaneta americana TaxID=6978 RepID=A0ABQ8SSU0_PERAM|nr:hypothetical protein ANN_17369 [Periplaneta americana]